MTGGSVNEFLGAYGSSIVNVSGGSIGMEGVFGEDSSVVTISGGDVEYLWAHDSSTLTLSGGTVSDMVVFDSSRVTVSGGWVYTYLDVFGSPTVTITGGSVADVFVYDSATITVTGGSPGGLYFGGSSTVTVTGGDYVGIVSAGGSSTATLSGGEQIGDLLADDSSTIYVIGGGFRVDGVWVPYGDLVATTGELSGTLASGEPINTDFCQGGGSCTGTITLLFPPECSDFADNDGDGLIDYPDDPGCENALSNLESPQCQDGEDNDGDGVIDFDAGQSIWGECSGEWGGCPPGVSDLGGDGVPNPDPQCVGKPWKDQERASGGGGCGLGTELLLLLPPLMWLSLRRRGRVSEPRHRPVGTGPLTTLSCNSFEWGDSLSEQLPSVRRHHPPSPVGGFPVTNASNRPLPLLNPGNR
jgi:hypothetical protein